MTAGASQLRIETLGYPSTTDGPFANSMQIVRLRANVPLIPSEHDFFPPLVTMERVLGTLGLSIIFGRRRAEEDEPTDAYATMDRDVDPAELTVSRLNEHLANDKAPAVRITANTTGEYPGLLIAHRAEPIGRYACAYVGRSEHVVSARILRSDSGLYQVYEQGTLLAAVAHPNSNLQEAEDGMRSALTT